MDTNGVQSAEHDKMVEELKPEREGLLNMDAIDVQSKKPTVETEMLFTVSERPPLHTSIILGLQHFLAMFVGSLTLPFILSTTLCAGDDSLVKVELIGVQFFVNGFITMIQVLLGIRLPIIQGCTFSLMIPVMAYLELPQNRCPVIQDSCWQNNNGTNYDMPNITCVVRDSPEYQALWKSRLAIIQGSMMLASLVEIFVGFTGVVGYLMKYIGPLTICPAITLIGVTLVPTTVQFGSENWPVCIMALVIMILFSQYLSPVNIPLPAYTEQKRCGFTPVPVFKIFPIISAILVCWFFCFILTVSNAFPDKPTHWAYGGRTDIRADIIKDAPWFNFFWPGKYGLPRVDISLGLGLVAGLLTSVVESLGDYHACARMCGIPNPPKHALNRGIFVEGIGCFLAGLFGTGSGTTSYSENIAVVRLTKVGSRVVVVYAACFMIFIGVFSKFGALFVTIPTPVIGASFMILFGMIMAVGLSNLQHVNMDLSRNLFVIGFSLFMGMTVPAWMKENNGAIHTGVDVLDGIFSVMLSTSMFVGSVIAFILDNTLPGTKKDRGLLVHEYQQADSFDRSEDVMTGHCEEDKDMYDIPFCRGIFKRFRVFSYLPICPLYGKHPVSDEAKSNDDVIPNNPCDEHSENQV